MGISYIYAKCYTQAIVICIYIPLCLQQVFKYLDSIFFSLELISIVEKGLYIESDIWDRSIGQRHDCGVLLQMY